MSKKGKLKKTLAPIVQSDEPKSFDPHDRVRMDDADQLRALSEVLEATPEEIGEAVEKVGDHPRAVAIFLGKGAVD